MALSGGTDTSDLLGGFEQLEPRRRLQVTYPICHLDSHTCQKTSLAIFLLQLTMSLKKFCHGLKLPE